MNQRATDEEVYNNSSLGNQEVLLTEMGTPRVITTESVKSKPQYPPDATPKSSRILPLEPQSIGQNQLCKSLEILYCDIKQLIQLNKQLVIVTNE